MVAVAIGLSLSMSLCVILANAKAPRWCARCRCAHTSSCPSVPKRTWVKRSSESGRGGSKWRARRRRIFIRDRFLCQRCFRKNIITPVELHGPKHGVCDHIVPIKAGGSDDEKNLETLCQKCNVEKIPEDRQLIAKGRG